MFFNARYYSSAIGRFISADSIVPDENNPQAWNRYAYSLSNPLKYTDPSGHCPAPPANMGPAICLALFIKPPTVSVAGGMYILHGDDRDFSNDSDPGASRGFIWIETERNNYAWKMNQTGYVSEPIAEGFESPYITWMGPSPENKWTVERRDNGDISVTYDLVLAGDPLEHAAPHINGTVTFRPRKDGTGYDAFGPIDGFPWAEAYYWDSDGKVHTIFQQSAIDSDPENLNNLEPNREASRGYPFYWYRDTFLVDPKYRGIKTYINTQTHLGVD
jgi:hypothetical protein